MYRILASAAALALLSAAASAADLPVYEAPVEAAPVLAAWNWSGIYGGLHGGYSWGESDVEGIGTFDDFDGGIVGGQVGANYQWNWVVLGVEADGTYSMAETTEDIGGGVTLNLETEWMASARGRLGVAFNRFMVYGTGGAAWAHVDADLFGAPIVAAGLITGSDDQTHFGWVAGGGVEMMATRNITLGVEFLHYEFEDETYEGGALGPVDVDYDTDVIRGRVNVKFNSLFGG